MDASREAAYYKEQFNHATEELKDAEAQRDQFKQDLARTRSFAQIARSGDGDSEVVSGSSGAADSVELHNVSAFTIEVLETLEARERELRDTKGELEMYARDFGIIWQQQCLLYQEHAASVKAMKQQLDAAKVSCRRAEAEAALLAKKCASQDELLDLQKSSAPPSQDFVDLRRKLIFTEAEKDSLERRLQVANDALEEANASNDAFRSDLLQAEIAFKKHQGAQQRRLQAMTAHVTQCDALIRESQPRSKYLELERNYHEVLSRCARDSEREMEVLHERSELHDLRKEADRLRSALSEAEAQLATERLKASSAMERLQQLSLSHGPSTKDQVAALMHKIVMFEVSERNALSKAAIAKQRQSEAESSLQMSDARIENLEQELRSTVEDRHRLQSQVRNYQIQNAESLSKEEATKMRRELEELRARTQKLDEEVIKQREGSELAQQQCKALLRVREVQKSEMSELRLLVQQLQGKNDDYLEYGQKEITLSRARRRIADLEHALDNSVSEKNRLEVVVLRLEEALDSRFEELMATREEARVRISSLEMAVADGAAVQHGSVSLDKVEKLRASLRQLTDQQRVSSEIAAQAKKKCVDLEGQLEDLQAESRAQKDMIERMRGGGVRGENDFLEMSKKLSDLRVQELRLKRQIRQLQDRESYLSQINESLEATVCELETKVVEQQHIEEKSTIDAKLKLERLEQALVEAHARERSSAANAAAMAARSAMHMGSEFSDAGSTRSRPHPGTYHHDASVSHHSTILSSDVRELQAQVLGLQNELDIARHELADASASARSGDADSMNDMPRRSHASDANTEHLEAMLDQAKITIENKQKVIASKNEMIQKYQKMLVDVRLEFLESKDEDAREIAHCKEELLHLRTRSSSVIDTSGPVDAAEVHRMREEIDTFVRRVQELEKEKQTWIAERDGIRSQRRSSVVSGGDAHRSSSVGGSAAAAAPVSHAPLSQDVEALQGEIRRLRRDLAARTHELDAKTSAIKEIRNEISNIDGPGKARHEAELRSFRESIASARVALSGLKASLAELTSSGAAPSAVSKIENGVRTAIESLGHVPGTDNTHTISNGEAKAMTDASDKLQQRLTQLQLRLSKMKEEVDDTNSRCAAAESKAAAKEKEASDNSERLKRVSADMRKAEAAVRDARDSLESKNAELEDALTRISALEHRLALLSSSKPAAAPSARPSSAGPAASSTPATEVRGRSVEQWETEKRLQDRAASMQKQITKLKDEAKSAAKALEDARAAWDKDKEGLQNRIRILESRKPNAAVDSEAPAAASRVSKGPNPDWNAVADAERRASAAELARMSSEANFAKAQIEISLLKEQLKGTEQMCEEQASRARSEGQRADEAQRMASASGLEREALLVAELRAVREELEEARNDAAVAHCESIEGRHAAQLSKYDAEHAHLTITALQARVRELERLPLGGDAGAVSALTSSIELASRDRLGELERLVTSLRKLVDKLQSENVSLRKAATTNVKYVELLRESKLLRAKLAAWEDTTGDGPGAQLAKAKAELLASKDAVRKAEAAASAASKQLKREQDEVSTLHSRLKDSEKLVAELQRKSEASRRSTEATAGEREASANARAAAAEKVCADMQARIKDLEERLRSAVNEVDVKKAQCIELKGRLHEASKRVADAEQMANAGSGVSARRVEDGESGEDSEVLCVQRFNC
jgi:chromosome segregation ATPase